MIRAWKALVFLLLCASGAAVLQQGILPVFPQVLLVYSVVCALIGAGLIVFPLIFAFSNFQPLDRWTAGVLMACFALLTVYSFEVGTIHPDELWRLDRSRHFVVLQDPYYANKAESSMTNTLVGSATLLSQGNPERMEWQTRMLLGVLPGIISVGVLYALLRSFASRTGAVLGSAMLLFSPHMLMLSRTFMSEPLQVFFVVAALFFSTKLLKRYRTSTAVLILSYALCSFLIKPTAVFFPLFFGLLILHRLQSHREPRQKLFVIGSIGASFVLLYYTHIFSITAIQHVFNMIFQTIRPPWWQVLAFGAVMGSAAASVLAFPRLQWPKITAVVAAGAIVCGSILAPRLHWLYHWRNALFNETGITLIFFSCVLLSSWMLRKQKQFSTLGLFSLTGSVLGIFLVSGLSKLLNDSFERHLTPYLPLLIVFSVVSLEKIRPLVSRDRFQNLIGFFIVFLALWSAFWAYKEDDWFVYSSPTRVVYQAAQQISVSPTDRVAVSAGNSSFWNGVYANLVSFYIADPFVTLDYFASGKVNDQPTGLYKNIFPVPSCHTTEKKVNPDFLRDQRITTLLQLNCGDSQTPNTSNMPTLDSAYCIYETGNSFQPLPEGVVEAEHWDAYEGVTLGRDLIDHCDRGHTSNARHVILRGPTEAVIHEFSVQPDQEYQLDVRASLKPIQLVISPGEIQTVLNPESKYTWLEGVRFTPSTESIRVEIRGDQAGYALVDQIRLLPLNGSQ